MMSAKDAKGAKGGLGESGTRSRSIYRATTPRFEAGRIEAGSVGDGDGAGEVAVPSFGRGGAGGGVETVAAPVVPAPVGEAPTPVEAATAGAETAVAADSVVVSS